MLTSYSILTSIHVCHRYLERLNNRCFIIVLINYNLNLYKFCTLIS